MACVPASSQAPEGRQRAAAEALLRRKRTRAYPIPPETNSVTKHDWTAGGQTIHYTATAGNLLIRDEQDKANGSIFYVAYTEDGADAKNRPVTFFYNGGPGAATIWLHMGSLGPVRVITQSPEATGPAPFEWVQNPQSLIDKSDLVFIDAPLCGFSRAVGKGTAKDFAGTDQDIHAFEKFIVRYITVNQRWNSPKFLFGESYGTTRSAGLVAALQNDGIEFNGVTLLSSILNYNRRAPGLDYEAIGYLPSYAAIAYHYKKVKTNVSMAEWVQQASSVCAWAVCRGAAAGRQVAGGGVRCDGGEGGGDHRVERGVREGVEAADLGDAVSQGAAARGRADSGTIRCAVYGVGPGFGGRESWVRSYRTRGSAGCMSGRSTTTSRES